MYHFRKIKDRQEREPPFLNKPDCGFDANEYDGSGFRPALTPKLRVSRSVREGAFRYTTGHQRSLPSPTNHMVKTAAEGDPIKNSKCNETNVSSRTMVAKFSDPQQMPFRNVDYCLKSVKTEISDDSDFMNLTRTGSGGLVMSKKISDSVEEMSRAKAQELCELFERSRTKNTKLYKMEDVQAKMVTKKVTPSPKIYAATKTMLSLQSGNARDPDSKKSVTHHPGEYDSVECEVTKELYNPTGSKENERTFDKEVKLAQAKAQELCELFERSSTKNTELYKMESVQAKIEMRKVNPSPKIYAATKTMLSLQSGNVRDPDSPKSVAQFSRQYDSGERSPHQGHEYVRIQSDSYGHECIYLNKTKRQESLDDYLHGHMLC